MSDPTWWNAGPGELSSDHEHEGARVVGHCTRCERPYFDRENLISKLCDACLDGEREIQRITEVAQQKAKAGAA
jgi:hypothetical protein